MSGRRVGGSAVPRARARTRTRTRSPPGRSSGVHTRSTCASTQSHTDASCHERGTKYRAPEVRLNGRAVCTLSRALMSSDGAKLQSAGGPSHEVPAPSSRGWGPGTVVAGKFRIDAVLGQGGMGVVYRAFHLDLEQ